MRRACRATRRPSAPAVLGATLLVAVVTSALGQVATSLARYAVPDGFSLEVASSGYRLPTSIAVVPEPGDGPDAPVYFVTELHGTIKVVTRDGSVGEYAAVPTWGRQEADLRGSSQQGLAGVCLAPDEGHVFVTFTEPDDGGVMRNRVVRFDGPPRTFSAEPEAATSIGAALAEFQSAPAHQIGNCVVWGGELYVGVGDGGDPAAAARPDVLLGKIVCMTFDGEPCASPALEGDGPEAYAWALGLRNPFGLAVVDDSLYVAENGVRVDRFLRVTAGVDHLWRGTDQSIASLADVVFVPAMAPVQLAHVPAGSPSMPPGWEGRFVAATYGSGDVPPGVVSFAFSGDDPGAAVVPDFLIEYAGPERSQHFGGVAVSGDGLLVVPMLPLENGESVVLRLRYDPDDAHPVRTSPGHGLERYPAMEAITRHGCTGCHSIAGHGGGIGPTLDRFAFDWRITERLNTEGYERQVAALDERDDEPFRSFRDARREVLAEEGIERTRVWLGHFLQEPRFDDPETQMPNLGLSRAEAEVVRDELFEVLGVRGASRPRGIVDRGVSFVRTNVRALALGAFAGGAAVLVVGAAWFALRRRGVRRA